MKFKIIPDEEANTQTIVLKTDGGNNNHNSMSGLDGIIGNWVSEQLRKSLEKKDEKKDDDKDKKKPKTYSKAEVFCWSLLLMFSAPWTGLWVIHALDSVKTQWAQVLMNAVK